MTRSTKRKVEVVLFGATGFTGKLVAEVLAERYGDGLRWALAGRDRAKLEQLRAQLAGRWPGAAEVPLVIADTGDAESLAAMAEQTKVVCTTVGPYSRYGAGVVAACAAAGTDYCDLTGETPFIRAMIDAHQGAAEASGARIVNCCGFDSIPSDLGTLVLQEHAIAELGQPAPAVTLYSWKMKGGFSGGTIASMKHMVDQAKRDRALRRALVDPYALDPAGGSRGPDGRDLAGPRFDDTIDAWVGPFVMAGINTRIVRRSNALLDYRYGRDFRYEEVTRFGRGLKGRAAATAMSVGMGGFMVGMALPPARFILDRVLPDPGEGPTREQIEAGYFDMRLIGRVGERELRVTVKADRDPGYGATATMLAESAVCLAQDRRKTPKRGGGIFTPATAMGLVLVERLRAAGMTFGVGS